MYGADFAYGRPHPASLRAAGIGFVCRYLGSTTRKAIDQEEARSYRDGGIAIVVVYEGKADGPLNGDTQGLYDGKHALLRADLIGLPDDRPIYAAVDRDVTPAQMPRVLAYLRSFAASIAPHPLGVYGGTAVIEAAFPHLAHYAWQANAWRDGRVIAAAQIQQGTSIVIDGVTCDRDEATAADFGAWLPKTGGSAMTDVTLATLDAKLDRLIADLPNIHADVRNTNAHEAAHHKETLAAIAAAAQHVPGSVELASTPDVTVQRLRAALLAAADSLK